MFDFTGERVVVTGITGGIARATAKLLLSEGAEVIVTARRAEKLERGLSGLTGKMSGGVVNLEDEATIRSFFEQTGSFDPLVTAASSSMLAPLTDLRKGN